MVPNVWRVTTVVFLCLIATCSEVSAAYVGDRFFPSTLAITVPTPAEFYNPPSFVKLPNTNATPSTSEVDVATTYNKLVTRDLSVFFTETFRILDDANKGARSGFDNLVIGAQYQLYTDTKHEFVFTIGGTAEIGGTGAPGIASSFSTLTPTVYVGKGFGDLPDSLAWLRPLAVTATFALAVPTDASTLTPSSTMTPPVSTTLTEMINPRVFQWGFALEYSLISNRYTAANSTGTRYAEGWVPLIEFALQTPLNGPTAGSTTGTINPGVIWVSRYLQAGVEAIIPLNASSGRDVGVRGQAHLYLAAMFPGLRPIFGD